VKEALAWVLVAVYCLWPLAWLFVKPVVMAPAQVFMPMPLGKVFSDVSLLDVHVSGGALERIRTRLGRLLARFAEVGLWPAGGITGRTLHTVTTGTARELHPLLAAYAVVSAILAWLLVALRGWTGPSLAVSVATLGLLATITARHVLWIVSGDGFRLLLRRSRPYPLATLVRLAAFDCLALVGIATVIRWTGDATFSTQRVTDAGTDLFSLRHVTRLTERSDLSPLLVALAAAVTAYWTSLAGQVIKFPAFKRSFDDRAWVAALWLDWGRRAEAADALKPVPGLYVSGPVLQVRIRLALAHGDFDRALALSRSLAGLLDPAQAGEDGAIVYLASQLYEIGGGVPALGWRVVEWALTKQVADAALFAVLTNLRNSGLGTVGPWEPRARELGLAPERHPLAWSWFVAQDSLSDARELLDAWQPSRPSDRAVRQVARFALWRELTAWPSREQNEEQLNEMLAVLAGVDVTGWPYWLRDYLQRNTWAIEQRARHHGLARAAELRAIRRRLVGLPEKQAEAILEDMDVTQRARLRAAQTSRETMLGIEPW
jgi:hypothetical protein